MRTVARFVAGFRDRSRASSMVVLLGLLTVGVSATSAQSSPTPDAHESGGDAGQVIHATDVGASLVATSRVSFVAEAAKQPAVGRPPATQGVDPGSSPALDPSRPTVEPSAGDRAAGGPDGSQILAAYTADSGHDQPPDVTGGVSERYVVVAHNAAISVLDRSGAMRASQSWGNLFQSLGPTKPFDPQVRFDSLAGTWLISAGYGASAKGANDGGLLLGVSLTDDPTADWYLYRFTLPTQLYDQPRLGYSDRWVAVSANAWEPTGGPVVFAFDKPSLALGKPVWWTFFTRPAGGWYLQAASTYDRSLGGDLLLATSDGALGALFVWRLADDGNGTPVLSKGPPLAGALRWDAGPDHSAPQLGTSATIELGWSAPMTGVWMSDAPGGCAVRHARMWCAQMVYLPRGDPVRSSIQWWELDPAGSVVQSGLVDDASASFDGRPSGDLFGYPSIAVNGDEDVLLAYSHFASDEYPGAHYSLRLGSDPAGTLRGDRPLRSGSGPYGTKGEQRWGDYTTSAVDPADDHALWTLQQYSAPTTTQPNGWGIWWADVEPPPPAP